FRQLRARRSFSARYDTGPRWADPRARDLEGQMISRQALRRLRSQVMLLVAVVLAATALTFFVTEVLPGDAAVAILGDTATEADIKSLRAELGLERPLVVRYVDWLGNALTGDLGRSYRTREYIATMIGQRLPVT